MSGMIGKPRDEKLVLPPEREAEARALRGAGWSLDRIASVVGVSTFVLRRHLPPGNLPVGRSTANKVRGSRAGWANRRQQERSHGGAP